MKEVFRYSSRFGRHSYVAILIMAFVLNMIVGPIMFIPYILGMTYNMFGVNYLWCLLIVVTYSVARYFCCKVVVDVDKVTIYSNIFVGIIRRPKVFPIKSISSVNCEEKSRQLVFNMKGAYKPEVVNCRFLRGERLWAARNYISGSIGRVESAERERQRALEAGAFAEAEGSYARFDIDKEVIKKELKKFALTLWFAIGFYMVAAIFLCLGGYNNGTVSLEPFGVTVLVIVVINIAMFWNYRTTPTLSNYPGTVAIKGRDLYIDDRRFSYESIKCYKMTDPGKRHPAHRKNKGAEMRKLVLYTTEGRFTYHFGRIPREIDNLPVYGSIYRAIKKEYGEKLLVNQTYQEYERRVSRVIR